MKHRKLRCFIFSKFTTFVLVEEIFFLWYNNFGEIMLSVENLCFGYYKQPLCLKDVNFKLEKGKKAAIIASSGMGKTTLLSVLSGFETSFFGKVEVDGKEVRKIPDMEKNFSILFSTPVFFKDKTIKQNFDFLSKTINKDFDENEIQEKLKICKLNEKLETKVKKLSILNQRKLAFARSLLKSPELVFVDDQFEKAEIDDEFFKVFEKFLDGKTCVCTFGNESYKNCKNYLKLLKFDYIFYLYDAKFIKFNSFEEFENSLLNINTFKFLDGDFKFLECQVQRQEKFFNVFFGDKFFSLNEKFFKKLEKLNLQVDEFEDTLLCFQGEFDLKISEEEFNQLLSENKIFIFSAIDGERLI